MRERDEEKLAADMGRLMLEKLRQNSHKPHWRESNLLALFAGLLDEVRELNVAVGALANLEWRLRALQAAAEPDSLAGRLAARDAYELQRVLGVVPQKTIAEVARQTALEAADVANFAAMIADLASRHLPEQ